MRIFLIGFMGSGKTYWGRRMAEMLGLPFVDLDDYVVQRAGMPISDIFEQQSEKRFRDLEREVLMELSPLPSFVMATGGGTPCYYRLMDHLNSVGITVFLDPSPELLIKRLRPEIGHRPLLAKTDALEDAILEKLHERRSCYEQARIHLAFDDPDTDIARLVLDQLPSH